MVGMLVGGTYFQRPLVFDTSAAASQLMNSRGKHCMQLRGGSSARLHGGGGDGGHDERALRRRVAVRDFEVLLHELRRATTVSNVAVQRGVQNSGWPGCPKNLSSS